MVHALQSGWPWRDYDLVDDLVVVGFSFRDLTPESLKILSDLSMPSTKEICEAVLKTCEQPLYELTILTKCNAILLVAIALRPTSASVIQAALIDVWSKRTDGKVNKYKNEIQRYAGVRALRFLHETAVGLQSVTLGDSQVFNQVRQAISAVNYRAGALSVLGRLEASLRFTKNQVEKNTKLFQGQMSLERIACEIVWNAFAPGSQVAIIGSGMTANLLATVLFDEYSVSPTIFARNETALLEMRTKLPGLTTGALSDLKAIAACDIIIIALQINGETSAYVKELYAEINGTGSHKFLIIDMSSPGFDEKPDPSFVFHSIKDLSEKAAAINKMREAEIPAARDIILQQLPIVTERVRMENLNRYLGTLDMTECRLEQKKRSWSSLVRIFGISVLASFSLTSVLGQSFFNVPLPPWMYFPSVLLIFCFLSWLITKIRFPATWADVVVKKASSAYTRRLIPLTVDHKCLERIYALGISVSGVEGFIPRDTLFWLHKKAPESVRAWTMAGRNDDVCCFYVAAPLSKRGVNRMLLRKVRKDSELEEADTCRSFRSARGLYIIETLGVDNLSKASILAAVRIDMIYRVKHSRIECLFSRPVSKFGERQLIKARFSHLGKEEHEMQMKTIYETSDVRHPQFIEY